MSIGSKVIVEYRKNGQEDLIHIEIADHSASVQDLLDAWQPLCSRSDIPKKYAPGGGGDCEGCIHNCCNAAFIVPDLISFKSSAALLEMDEKEYVSHYFDPAKLQAGILRWRSEPCIFLHDLRCSIYPCRSLLCRLYLCSPLDGDSEELIYKISWTGAAATLLYARHQGLMESLPMISTLDSFDRLLAGLLLEYQERSEIELFFQAAGYADIPLAPFIVQ